MFNKQKKARFCFLRKQTLGLGITSRVKRDTSTVTFKFNCHFCLSVDDSMFVASLLGYWLPLFITANVDVFSTYTNMLTLYLVTFCLSGRSHERALELLERS